jgi:hypothetical protein
MRKVAVACCSVLAFASAALADEPDAPEFQAAFGLSAGATTRAIEYVAAQGTRRLDTGLIPALGMRVQGQLQREYLQLTAAVTYQTSLHGIAVQHTSDPYSQALHTPLRSQRFEAGILPAVRFNTSADSTSLGLFIGYSLRAFSSVAELGVPRYTLHGPVLRLELELPLFARLRLRLAPEAVAIVSMTHTLQEAAASTPIFAAIGGEVSLRFAVADWLEATVMYRESRVQAGGRSVRGFSDRERFVLAGGHVAF